MLRLLYQTFGYLLKPTVKSWRLLRTELMARLPKSEKREAEDA